MQGFARVSAAVPVCRVGDARLNADRTIELFEASHAQGDAVVVFPELGLTGYTVRDLFADQHLLSEALDALERVTDASESLGPLAIVGLPLRVGPGIYNVAAAVQDGSILAVVPKSYLPNYREFEEARWFRPGREVAPGSHVELFGEHVPFGTDILLHAWDELVVGIELCEDIWVQVPPSSLQASAGATIICNLSASNFTIGKAQLRRLLAKSASDRNKCAYIYVAAGPGESSTDLAFDADAFICENGSELVASRRFSRDPQLVTVDIDLDFLMRDRLVTTSFGDCAQLYGDDFRRVHFTGLTAIRPPLRRPVARHPFVPSDPATLGERCWEIFEIQTNALATRMQAIGEPKLVLGISGGLDSTQAALVCAGALDLLQRPRGDLVCITMPGLGTSPGTRGNAEALARALGADFSEIPISEASRVVLSLLGHPAVENVDDLPGLLDKLRADPRLGDVTLENVQARMRTLLLMSVANRAGGLVVGTGDLSEKALGWATYAGDHIAMYDVNAGVPKTLIQSVIRWVANERATTWSQGDHTALRQTLFAILDTPISPELLPTDTDGSIAQLTEDAIGPYELHDFFLYHLVRHGARPTRILDIAQVAWSGDYDLETIKKHLRVFLRRFFHHQFKRSCTADAPKVGQVALSPRGDWRMPSDASVDTWLAEVDDY
jgi:NAD+ synthase (glutamine-hydrolysing)